MQQVAKRAVVIAVANSKIEKSLTVYYECLGFEVFCQFEDAPDRVGGLLLAREIRKTGEYSSVEVVP